jgi:hypothetical protein
MRKHLKRNTLAVDARVGVAPRNIPLETLRVALGGLGEVVGKVRCGNELAPESEKAKQKKGQALVLGESRLAPSSPDNFYGDQRTR